MERAAFTFDLTDRVALVTGASSGLGRHFAKTLAASGAIVAIAARRAGLLTELECEIRDNGGRALSIEMDVADEASTITAFDRIADSVGPVDSVVCNAGMGVGGSALGLALDDFDRMVSVNLRGTFMTAREAGRRMIAAGAPDRKHGRVVIISSITGHSIQQGHAAYSATKAGVTQMGRVLAREWAGKGVNVNTICPGYMRTELTEDWLDLEKGKALLAGFPRGRVMEIDALDPILLYLCSNASAPVTGSVFTIDDGQAL